jgi:dienelactone hydrolase
MLRAIFTLISLVTLSAWAVGPQDPAPGTAPIVETVTMAGGFSPIVKIPVEDAKTTFVAGALFEPKGGGPFPAVILLHGCAGSGLSKDAFTRVISDYLPKGIAILIIDSFTSRGMTDDCGNPNIAYRVKDTYAAISWLSARAEIDSKHIFLQGYSMGARTAIEVTEVGAQATTTRQPKIAGVIAFYPYCSPGTKFSVPTIILIGKADDWTPAELCEAIIDKTNVKITAYPNATHGFTTPGDHMLRGHRLLYNQEATDDGQRRALALIQSLTK